MDQHEPEQKQVCGDCGRTYPADEPLPPIAHFWVYMTLPSGTEKISIFFMQDGRQGKPRVYTRIFTDEKLSYMGIPVTRDQYGQPKEHADEGWYKFKWDLMDQKGIVKMSHNYNCVVRITDIAASRVLVGPQGPFYSHYIDDDTSPSQAYGDSLPEFYGVAIDHTGQPIKESIRLYGATKTLHPGKWSYLEENDPKGMITELSPIDGISINDTQGVNVALNQASGTSFVVGDSAKVTYTRLIGEYKHKAGIENLCVGREVTLVCVDIKSVEWQRFAVFGHLLYGTVLNPPLTQCPNNGGLRIYPGKASPEEIFPFRNVVKVTAELSTSAPVGGVRLWFRVFDVDDPRAQTEPVDDDQNRPKHNDNRPRSGGIGARFGNDQVVYSVPLDYGHTGAIAYLGLDSIQPGNNWVVVASCDEQYVRGMTVDATDGVTIRDANGNEVLAKTPMLTCWRKLHVEVDSMAQEPNSEAQKSPDIHHFIGESVTVNCPKAGQTTIDTFGPIFAPTVDFYEGGRVTKLGDSWEVVGHSANNLFGDEIVISGVLTPAQIANIEDQVVGIRDDDPIAPQLPYYPSLSGFVADVFEPAYIMLVRLDDTYNTNRIVPFNLNLTDLELVGGIDWDNGQDVWSSADFWTTLLVSCYQPEQGDDQDPDMFEGANNTGGFRQTGDPSVTWGATTEEDDNSSAVFIETIRDAAHRMVTDLAHVIVHEIGHAGGTPNDPDDEHAEGGIMSDGAPSTETSFSALTITRFRDAEKW